MELKQGDLERLYREAGRSLRSDILSINLVQFDGDKADMIKRKARLTIAGLNLAAEEWVNTAMKDEGMRAERKARVALEILGRKPKRPQITDPGYNARMKALETMIKANNSIMANVDKYLSVALVASHRARTVQAQEFRYDEAAAELDAIALEALLKEKSRGWLSKQIIEFLRSLIEADEFIEINGRMYKMSKYAKMVARTEMKHTQDDATNDLCKQYENDLVQISDHGCDCDECEKFEGNIYSLSGNHPKYSALADSGYLDVHPNCRHSETPTSEEAITVLERHRRGESTLRRTIREEKERKAREGLGAQGT